MTNEWVFLPLVNAVQRKFLDDESVLYLSFPIRELLTNDLCLLGAGNVASVTVPSNFSFHLKVNNHMWLVATLLESVTPGLRFLKAPSKLRKEVRSNQSPNTIYM